MFKVCGPGEIMQELTIVTMMHYLELREAGLQSPYSSFVESMWLSMDWIVHMLTAVPYPDQSSCML